MLSKAREEGGKRHQDHPAETLTFDEVVPGAEPNCSINEDKVVDLEC